MFDFYERRKIKQRLFSWPAIVVLIILCVWLIRGVWDVYMQERQTRINKDQRLSHLEELQEREYALQTEIDRLNTDRGIEAELRQKLEVAKEGEQVIVLLDAPEIPSGGQAGEPEGFFARMLGTVIFWR